MRACFLFAALCVVACLAEDAPAVGLVPVPQSESTEGATFTLDELKGMRLRELRRMLAERGLECIGCTEKGLKAHELHVFIHF